MKKLLRYYGASSVFFLMMQFQVFSQVAGVPAVKYWKPQSDDVYLQESADRIVTAEPVTGIGIDGNRCLAIMGGKVYLLDGATLAEDKGAPENVKRLVSAGGELWALSSGGTFKSVNGKWQKVDNREFVDLCFHQGVVHAASKDDIFKLEGGKFISLKPVGGFNSSDVTVIMEDGSQVHAEPVKLGPVERIESHTGSLYLLEPGKLILFDGLMVNRDFVDWGSLPSGTTTDMLSSGNRLFITTSKGLAVMRGAAISAIKGTDGLPVENTTCIVNGFEDDLWIGTTSGAVRMLKNEWQFFGADQWLPGGHVNDIAAGKNMICIATDKGIGILRYEPYTLLKKAAYYEQRLDDWGHKRMGFIHPLVKKDDKWIRKITDNDGGNTATYLTAECFKYAVTRDETARREAVNSFNAMVWLQQITNTKGFFARAIWSVSGDEDEMEKEGSGGLPARWYPTKDGKWYWKGDTSSDEVTSHFYAVALFYDLVAQGIEKEMARKHLEKIATYIMQNGWVLKDLDGKPTRWGHWNPEYLLRPYGYTDRGLNGLEALNFMETAYHVTGDIKFRKGQEQLIKWGYDQNTIRQKNVFPPEAIAPWDDDLAFESYNTILRYVSDPGLHSILLRSLERTWEVKRMAHSPWYNFSYGVFTGNDCDLEQSLESLRAFRLDCIQYSYQNSVRDDIYAEHGYTSYEGIIRSFSPREANARLEIDGGKNGNSMTEPTEFLRDYWMARYYGFILPPSASDPDLVSVKPSGLKNPGAKPYDGPARPVLY